MQRTGFVLMVACASWFVATSCGDSDADTQPSDGFGMDGGGDAASHDASPQSNAGSSAGGQGNDGEDSGAGQGGEGPSGGAQNSAGHANIDPDAGPTGTDASPDDADASGLPGIDASDLDATAADSGTFDAGALDASDAGGDAGPGTIVFVNWCDGNCNITQGPDSSANNTSTVVTEPETIGPLSENATVRGAALSCFESLLAPFHVTLTETDPGPAEHIEIVAAGSPTALGFSPGVSWVAPLTCSLDPDGIGFAFLEVWGSDSAGMCESLALAFGTLAGLEPSYACNEAMSYVAACGTKQYTDADLSCGTASAQACQCPRASQNSYQLLLAALGAAP